MCVQCIEPFEHGGGALVCAYNVLSYLGMEVVPSVYA